MFPFVATHIFQMSVVITVLLSNGTCLGTCEYSELTLMFSVSYTKYSVTEPCRHASTGQPQSGPGDSSSTSTGSSSWSTEERGMHIGILMVLTTLKFCLRFFFKCFYRFTDPLNHFTGAFLKLFVEKFFFWNCSSFNSFFAAGYSILGLKIMQNRA